MSKEVLCDICNKPIKARHGIFGSTTFSKYVVKIKRIEKYFNLHGGFNNSEILDICPECMDKFVEFAKKEGV